jgi:hypothetical protein
MEGLDKGYQTHQLVDGTGRARCDCLNSFVVAGGMGCRNARVAYHGLEPRQRFDLHHQLPELVVYA